MHCMCYVPVWQEAGRTQTQAGTRGVSLSAGSVLTTVKKQSNKNLCIRVKSPVLGVCVRLCGSCSVSVMMSFNHLLTPLQYQISQHENIAKKSLTPWW